MLSALFTDTGEQVILLKEDGRERAETLRTLAHQGRLICEVCEEPILVRAGDERLWHFAHKVRKNCPKDEETLELVACRALLYRWLREKFKECVRLEKVLPGSGLPRPVDCWVELADGRRFAWWIVSAQLKPSERSRLKAVFDSRGVRYQILFTANRLHRDPSHPEAVTLSSTEREFLFESEYDAIYGASHGSLHFLDPARGILTTYRSLMPVHPPQGYQGEWLERPLFELLIHPRNGEPVHPGEHERLQQLREKEARRQEAERRQQALEASQREEGRRRAEAARREWEAESARQREAALERRLKLQQDWDAEHAPPATVQPGFPLGPEAPSPPEAAAASLSSQTTPVKFNGGLPGSGSARSPLADVLTPEGRCRKCGTVTRVWTTYDGATGLCLCRSCAHLSRQAGPKV